MDRFWTVINSKVLVSRPNPSQIFRNKWCLWNFCSARFVSSQKPEFFHHFRTPGQVKMTFGCARITYIYDDKIVLSLKYGELYVLTLCAISVRGVLSFHQLAFVKSTYSWASA
jgi:hypothetical protein